ncbi:hypothetical protein [Burkholderia glumae]|uniref:hypothetical protein n=1 Tax=Burkholderia glumae TaxID=337 RepID=UPI002151BBAC|nr:hypothetical protein [Burkholderia glumae]
MSTLSNAIDIAQRIENTHAPAFEKASAAIGFCVAGAERGRRFTLTEAELTTIAVALVVRDAHLARVTNPNLSHLPILPAGDPDEAHY